MTTEVLEAPADQKTETESAAPVETKTTETPPNEAPKDAKPNGKAPIVEQPEGEAKPAKKGSIAAGADDDDEEVEAKPKDAKSYWPDDWREKMAERISAGDKKVYDRELKRLQRITDPTGVYGNYRELDNRLNGGGLVKVPGKDAKPEEIEAFHKALGVPEKPEDYFKSIKLDNGAVIGDADKPLVDGVVARVHKAGATPAVVNEMLNWYYQQQEEQAAALDEADDTFRREAMQALKDEFGASFKRSVNAIPALFATAPGGTDIKNENSLYARLMGGRTADGKIIGNDPDMVRFLVGLAREVNPVATVVEDGKSAADVHARLAEIQKLRSTDSKRYWSNEIQTEELSLINAIEKEKSRARA